MRMSYVCRDLMKLCSRLEHHVTKNRIQLTSELIFVEAVDCFCACLPVTAGRMQMMFEIGKRLNFSHNEVSPTFFKLHELYSWNSYAAILMKLETVLALN